MNLQELANSLTESEANELIRLLNQRFPKPGLGKLPEKVLALAVKREKPISASEVKQSVRQARKASPDTIRQMFQQLANDGHGSIVGTGNRAKFSNVKPPAKPPQKPKESLFDPEFYGSKGKLLDLTAYLNKPSVEDREAKMLMEDWNKNTTIETIRYNPTVSTFGNLFHYMVNWNIEETPQLPVVNQDPDQYGNPWKRDQLINKLNSYRIVGDEAKAKVSEWNEKTTIEKIQVDGGYYF